MHTPKLPVVVPCWNCEKYIAQLLNCILNQSFQDWRLLLIDDHSTDNTAVVVKGFSKKDQRIAYHLRNRLPKGAQTCRNMGLSLASDSEYVIFFDADDLIAPYCFEQRVSYMDLHKDLDFAIFPALMVCEDHKYHYVYGYQLFDDTLKALLNWTLPMVGWTNIYRVLSYKERKLEWDENLLSMQDSDFNIQALLKGCKYAYADTKPDYFYRIFKTNGSISSKISSKQHLKSHLHLIKKILLSLDVGQLEKYDKDLECYLLKFIRIFATDVTTMKAFVNIPWIKVRKWYAIRALACAYISPKAIKLLFPKIKRLNARNMQKWELLMNEKYMDIKSYDKLYGFQE